MVAQPFTDVGNSMSPPRSLALASAKDVQERQALTRKVTGVPVPCRATGRARRRVPPGG